MILKVCVGSACHVKGSYDVIEIIKEIIAKERLENKIELKACFCLNKCLDGVSVSLGEDGETIQLNKDNVYETIRGLIIGGKI